MGKKKILVVEDEKDIAENIQVRLDVTGYAVVNAYDGKEAVEMARKEKPDLILLDIMLPKINGIEVCEIIRSDVKLNKIPIIMITSLSAVGDVEKAFSAGANDYLPKPFEYGRLLNKIKKFI